MCFFLASCIFLLVTLSSSHLPLGKNLAFSTTSYPLLGLASFLFYLHCLKLSPQKAKRWILSLSLSLSLMLILYPASDDVARYFWEGAIANHGYNPYKTAPLSLQSSELAETFPLYETINHKPMTAIYGAFYLVIMRLLNALTSFQNVLISYKVLIFLLSSGITLLLLEQLKKAKLHPAHAALGVFNPLWLFFVVGEAHLDVIQIALLFLALSLKDRKRTFWMMLCFALSCHIKISSIIFLPFFLREAFGRGTLILLASLLLYLPYYEPGGLHYFTKSLTTFTESMFYNPLFYPLVNLFKNAAWLILGLGLTSLSLLSRASLRSLFLSYLMLLLLAPVLHPWYLGFLVILNCFVKSKSVILWSMLYVFSFPLYHRYFYSTGIWIEEPHTRYLVHLPFLLCLLIEWQKTRFFSAHKALEPVFLSIIIPTLNEEKNISKQLEWLKKCVIPVPHEVIIADGGSDDKTLVIAQKQQAKIVKAQRGRGLQIKAALQEAQGNLACVLHSDIQLDVTAMKRMLEFFRTHPRHAILSFSMNYNQPQGLKIIRYLNELRVRLSGISFGDQVQCFRKDLLDEVGGFPQMKLFEDVELAIRLKSIGKTAHLKNGGVVSARKWMAQSKVKHFFKIIFLCSFYLVLRFFKADSEGKLLYSLYYR